MNKAISFFLGLLFGILACVLLFYFDVQLYKTNCPECKEKEVITVVKTDTVFVEIEVKPKKQYSETKVTEPVAVENIDEEQPESEVSIYETEFSLEGMEQDDVFSDRLLQTRSVKVKTNFQGKQEVRLPNGFFQFFELQQWSTPIKNKITYYRDKNMVKIKGMIIDNMNVVFWDDAYFLEIDNRYYAIPETKYFEKLNLVQIPQ